MATLPELVSTPVEFSLKGHTFTVQPLTLLDIAEVVGTAERAKQERGEMYAEMFTMVLLFEKVLKKSYPETTLDYAAQLITGESSEIITPIIQLIGGNFPKVPIGEQSLPVSVTEPVGDPAILPS